MAATVPWNRGGPVGEGLGLIDGSPARVGDDGGPPEGAPTDTEEQAISRSPSPTIERLTGSRVTTT